MPVLGRNAVATSQPLAAQAGLQMLYRGGSAVDAALAAAIALTVVEPTSNGIGSDAFAVIWDGDTLQGLNGSGRSPAAWDALPLTVDRGIPEHGWGTVTVPGAVDAWFALWRRFGRLEFGELFEPAIGYADQGFMVSPTVAGQWAMAEDVYRGFQPFCATFLPEGRAPRPGELFRCPDQARTLADIASSNGESFYRGQIADRIVAHAAQTGGTLTLDDLGDHHSEWVEPLFQKYEDVVLYELPPNGQGIAALMALGILRHLKLHSYPMDSAEAIHLQVEAMKLAFVETFNHVADPAAMTIDAQQLLDEEFLAQRAAMIRMDRALALPVQPAQPGGTVYLAAADATGMMVSMIQSNYLGFGSGIVVPETGIALQNRGRGFTTQKDHPNRIAGKKRPFHTIIPAFAMRGAKPLIAFGVMGGAYAAPGSCADYNAHDRLRHESPGRARCTAVVS